MANDTEYKHALMLAMMLNETLCLILQSHDNNLPWTPEMLEKVRAIHAGANEMLGLEADA